MYTVDCVCRIDLKSACAGGQHGVRSHIRLAGALAVRKKNPKTLESHTISYTKTGFRKSEILYTLLATGVYLELVQ